MTTQVLMSKQAVLSEITVSTVVDRNTHSQTKGSAAAQSRQLPYQANHQVELLHLQAETEALLQHLKMLKQQKSVADLSNMEIETVVIASC
ncbi:hypothetical protein [Leptolyngbya sp. NK1-12]|uniref:hypothetical protein n=1 Tax=Leptolyngbya sp. NK1-12 TaxID=2547451 RepID=UPI0029312BB8|nr:hypothetical protein [Leptolyngbya sp. NK1-12]